MARDGYLATIRAIAVARKRVAFICMNRRSPSAFPRFGMSRAASGSTRSAARAAMRAQTSRGCVSSHRWRPSRSLNRGGAPLAPALSATLKCSAENRFHAPKLTRPNPAARAHPSPLRGGWPGEAGSGGEAAAGLNLAGDSQCGKNPHPSLRATLPARGRESSPEIQPQQLRAGSRDASPAPYQTLCTAKLHNAVRGDGESTWSLALRIFNRSSR